MTFPDKYYKDVIEPAKMGKGPVPSKIQMLSKSQPFKALSLPIQNFFSPGKYDAFRAQGTPAASKVLGGLGKGLGYLAKFLGPASFFFDSTAMGNAELPEGYDADQEYFDYYNQYGDNYSNLKIPGSNWRQKLMNQKIQQQKKKINMPEHLTNTPPSPQIQQVQQNIQTYGNRDRPNTGMNAPGAGKSQSPTGGDVAGTPFVRGGRVSYFDGGLASLWLR